MEKKTARKKVAPVKKKAPAKTKTAPAKNHTFILHAPHARTVSVVGDFNGWDAGKHPLKKDAKGDWKKLIKVAPGTYQYKYLVDGEWWLDPSKDTAPNPYGTENNVFSV